ncbi:MAG: 4-hydroxy-tetrahydrodipicolinate synthase [Anaerotignum sp.]|nr:4-hydroxy-tetrahydrodipicolinate synthase [Anaerotignum sp.]MBR5590860.1 4-hydroxy-tetrahydrodipicolinate synthase [Anaerotignum sp.]
MSIFTGAGTALVTPMNADGSVNFAKMKELIEFQIENSIDALIICGTTGEASTMSDEVQVECVRFAKEVAAGRCPIIAGAGSNDTAHCIELAQACEKAGADGVLLVTPYYNKATQKGLIMHYTAIANAINIPIILYNVPGRTGCNLAPKTVAELAKVENIVAVKEASGNLSQVAEIAALCGPDFDIYSGNDDQILPVLSLGGKGVISVLSNVAPKETHDMVMNYLNGDTKSATKLQLDAIELINALFCEVNPIPVKAALNLMGYEVGSCKLPLCDMEPKNLETLRTAMANYGLLK